MNNKNDWKVTERDTHCFTIVDPTERWKMRVKWDGCIDITHAYNGCLDEAEERDLVYLHICSLPELLVRLKAAAELISAETRDKRHTFWMANDDGVEAVKLFADEDYIEQLIRDESAASSSEHRMSVELNMAKVRLAQLEAFNIQLQATHQGGQTGVECAELQAQNNTLRHELGLAHQRNIQLSQQFEDFRNKAIYKSQ